MTEDSVSSCYYTAGCPSRRCYVELLDVKSIPSLSNLRCPICGGGHAWPREYSCISQFGGAPVMARTRGGALLAILCLLAVNPSLCSLPGRPPRARRLKTAPIGTSLLVCALHTYCWKYRSFLRPHGRELTMAESALAAALSTWTMLFSLRMTAADYTHSLACEPRFHRGIGGLMRALASAAGDWRRRPDPASDDGAGSCTDSFGLSSSNADEAAADCAGTTAERDATSGSTAADRPAAAGCAGEVAGGSGAGDSVAGATE